MKEHFKELWESYKIPIYTLMMIMCLAIIIIIFSVLSSEKSKYEIGNIVDDTFEVIDNKGNYAIVRDIDTGVCYWKKKGGYSSGNLCPIYDSNGKIMIKK